MRFARSLACSSLFLLSCTVPLVLQAEPDTSKLVAQFSVDNPKLAQAILDEQQRFTIVERQLINLLDSSSLTDMSLKEAVADMLGTLRSANATGALARNLIAVGAATSSGPGLTEHVGVYPCALALINIGQPSIEPLLGLLMNTVDPQVIEVATYSLRYILGAQETLALLKDRLKKSDYDREKRNLARAVAMLEQSPN